MQQTKMNHSELSKQARELYEQLRPKVEIPENIGKLIVLDAESGDYEIDDMGIESSRRLQDRHPGSTLYAFRIGYKTMESFGGVRERSVQS